MKGERRANNQSKSSVSMKQSNKNHQKPSCIRHLVLSPDEILKKNLEVCFDFSLESSRARVKLANPKYEKYNENE